MRPRKVQLYIMSRHDKLVARMRGIPANFTWPELVKVLSGFGYELLKGKGSRRKFVHKETKVVIIAHEPHPQKEIKAYLIEQILEKLGQEEL